MKNRWIAVLAGLFTPALAFATNGVGVLEMCPYVTGRDFPWAVPFIGLMLISTYLVKTMSAYRAIEGH